MENKINLDDIRRLSTETKFPQGLLEKDYHLTRILHKISEKKFKDLVFKGGTCLNKCYLGFYRLSEDLDFVYNQDVGNQSKMQIKKILDKLRREIINILNELELETSEELGKGWKMLTSKEGPKIIGLEVVTKYRSLLDNSLQTIKIEISFRNRLIKSARMEKIHHEFIDALGQPILKKDVEIEAIDLSENFAEKFRALVTRKNIAIRDIYREFWWLMHILFRILCLRNSVFVWYNQQNCPYDIHFILKRNILKINEEIIELILLKINESRKEKFTREDLIRFINNLDSKTSGLNEKEISSVLKFDEVVNVKNMVQAIIKTFRDIEENQERTLQRTA